jgi:DNA-binding PadR family transcriptional regulator
MNLRETILMMFRLGTTKYVSKKDFNVIHTYFYATINQMVKDGILEAQLTLNDSRERIYVLTDKGKKVIEKQRISQQNEKGKGLIL